jgi:hypothetical protein
LVPIAYCPKGDIDQVTNFVPGYLAMVTRHLWELYDKGDYIIDMISWNEEQNTLLDRFGNSIQHPKDHFVQYFGGTKPTLIEKGSPRRSPRKNPPETNYTDGRGLSSRSGSAGSRRSQGGRRSRPRGSGRGGQECCQSA